MTIPCRSIVRDYLIEPREIYFVCFLMEAYEGLASVSTLDPKLGLVRLHIAPGCETEVESILEFEAERLKWRKVKPADADLP